MDKGSTEFDFLSDVGVRVGRGELDVVVTRGRANGFVFTIAAKVFLSIINREIQIRDRQLMKQLKLALPDHSLGP